MIRCPGCGAVTKDIKYHGPVLFVEGTATVNDQGQIAAVGPARATLTVKSGAELLSLSVTVVCESCKFEGPASEFRVVRNSWFSNREATMEVITSLGISVPIAEDEQELALQVFSNERAEWRIPLSAFSEER